MDYDYVPSEPRKEILENTGKYSTTLKKLQEIDSQIQPATFRGLEADFESSEAQGVANAQGVAKGLATKEITPFLPEKKQAESLPIKEATFSLRVSKSFIDLVDDLAKGNINIDTFTKEDRLLSTIIFFIIVSVFFLFFNKIE